MAVIPDFHNHVAITGTDITQYFIKVNDNGYYSFDLAQLFPELYVGIEHDDPMADFNACYNNQAAWIYAIGSFKAAPFQLTSRDHTVTIKFDSDGDTPYVRVLAEIHRRTGWAITNHYSSGIVEGIATWTAENGAQDNHTIAKCACCGLKDATCWTSFNKDFSCFQCEDQFDQGE